MLDHKLLFWDKVDGANTGSSAQLDLGPERPGPGEIISGFVSAPDLDQSADPAVTMEMRTSANGTTWVVLQTIIIRASDPETGRGVLLRFHVPSNARRFVDIRFTSTPGGTFTAGLNYDQQTNG